MSYPRQAKGSLSSRKARDEVMLDAELEISVPGPASVQMPPPRSNSAGEPIVISSEEEEPTVKPTHRSPLAHRHHQHRRHECTHHGSRRRHGHHRHYSRSPSSHRRSRHKHSHHSSRGHGSSRGDPIVLSPDHPTALDHWSLRTGHKTHSDTVKRFLSWDHTHRNYHPSISPRRALTQPPHCPPSRPPLNPPSPRSSPYHSPNGRQLSNQTYHYPPNKSRLAFPSSHSSPYYSPNVEHPCNGHSRTFHYSSNKPPPTSPSSPSSYSSHYHCHSPNGRQPCNGRNTSLDVKGKRPLYGSRDSTMSVKRRRLSPHTNHQQVRLSPSHNGHVEHIGQRADARLQEMKKNSSPYHNRRSDICYTPTRLLNPHTLGGAASIKQEPLQEGYTTPPPPKAFKAALLSLHSSPLRHSAVKERKRMSDTEIERRSFKSDNKVVRGNTLADRRVRGNRLSGKEMRHTKSDGERESGSRVKLKLEREERGRWRYERTCDSTPEMSPVRKSNIPSGCLKQKRLDNYFHDSNTTPPLNKTTPTPRHVFRDRVGHPCRTPTRKDNVTSSLSNVLSSTATSGKQSECGVAAHQSPALYHALPSTPPLPLTPHTSLSVAKKSPSSQKEPTPGPVHTIPRWSEGELKMKAEPRTTGALQIIPGVCVAVAESASRPVTTCSWNYVEVYMNARDNAKFVEALEELTSRGRHIPDGHIITVLKYILCISDHSLLLCLHSILQTDASYRPGIALPAHTVWELMEDCCRRFLPSITDTHTTKSPLPPLYPYSAHIVILYLVSLLGADVTARTVDTLSAALVECVLSLTAQWRHVVVIVDLILELLLNYRLPPALPLPDLLPALMSLLCMCVSTSGERNREDGSIRLARELSSRMANLSRELSSRMANLSPRQLKTDLLLLIPCPLLREKTISIHLQNEFLLPSPSSSSSSPAPPCEHVTLDLIATSHLQRCPCHHDGAPQDLTFFLSLLYHLLHSHCSRLLGHSFLQSNTTSSSTILPSQLAKQLHPISQLIQQLSRRLSEDDSLLLELTSPHCWFYLQLLESMFMWELQ